MTDRNENAAACPVTDYFGLAATIRSAESFLDHSLRERGNQVFSWMQPGLVYPAPFQCALSIFNLPEGMGRAAFATILDRARRLIHSDYGSLHASVCVAFSLSTWSRFCREDGLPFPKGAAFDEPGSDLDRPAVVDRAIGVLQSSGVAAWIIVKADKGTAVQDIADFLVGELGSMQVPDKDIYRVDMRSRINPTMPDGGKGGRVLGGRFKENLRNPVSPVEMLQHVLVGGEDMASAGGTFLFTQRFELNWAELQCKTAHEMESAVGRRPFSNELIPTFDSRSHIRSAHTYDESGNTVKILRIGLPFGARNSASGGTPLVQDAGSASLGDEQGVYFIGLAKSARRLETILRSQFGNGDGAFARDRLLSGSLARSNLGGFFYAPSIRELEVPVFQDDAKRRAQSNFSSWNRFPGVDWSRFVRHFDQRSANGWMFYNHQDYLYFHGTRTNESGEDKPASPSLRVQFLLERMFSKWDDTWFRPQKPDELAPLRSQLERFFSDKRHAEERNRLLSDAGISDPEDPAKAAATWVMGRPVAERSAWAGRILCNLAARPDGVGARGNGGMDLCDIHPLDLLAGSMPAQSLAEGRYFIDYVRDDDDDRERYRWYTLGLGPNSGVGHVVPGYESVLKTGLNGVSVQIDEAEADLRSAQPERADAAASFYVAARLAVRGVTEYLGGLADTVAQKAAELTTDQALERGNLALLEARLRWLSKGHAPRTLIEALQLVFSCHAVIHLCGEPVAVGRLDRMLRPFQEQERLSEEELQEAIDCFWLKLAEKVLLNRIFIDDRQQLGNMAMGNRAGPYPKGQSVNQWIQQLTIGGANPDGTWEYSDVTVACLRASARLPFNAPVLSLRVSRNMPSEWRERLLQEAAFGQLSGGASPILMNDDKIVPALAGSGDNIGPPETSPAAELWHSKVRLEDAHDYAADGCYEPQFVGANWFTLGGAILLQPLEYALNEGRQIQGAGPVDLFGKNMSFRSPPAAQIESYDELEALFFKHLEWSYARQMEGSIADFGRMEAVCPAPLLSLFINDCLKKGQDIYGGGARYNVFGPCFTSLANTINSLWAIKTMCFNPETAVTTLPELVQALRSNWGQNPIDPLIHSTVLAADPVRVMDVSRRFRHLRSIALGLPRWGRGEADIDAFGARIASAVATMAVRIMTEPRPALATQFEAAAKRFGTKTHPFGGFSMQPGVGTFASYVEQGMGCGASPDGRLSGQPLGTDMSPSPSPLDQPATADSQQLADAVTVLKGMASSDSYGYANGAPLDFNIAEDMSVERLVEILDAFTEGAGSNVLTVTTADQATFLSATTTPESFDLLRVRMGGWTEMFVAMHATHQQVHPRRPYSV